jgi:hypothetical protein
MSLTYLDSVMIENPAIFRELSAARLSADLFLGNRASFTSLTADSALIRSLDISNLELQGFTSTGTINTVGLSSQSFTNSGDISNRVGNIFTLGLSTQRLSADIGRFQNLRVQDLSGFNAIFENLTANNVTFRDLKFGENIANTLYVSVSGDDNNTGRSIFEPLRTIKKACQVAHNARVASGNNTNVRFTIFVGSGEYYEDNPIYVAPNTSIIGDNLRRVSVRPNYPLYDILWVDNSVYVWGVTFRGHHGKSAAAAFPNFAAGTTAPAVTSIALSTVGDVLTTPAGGWRRPVIFTSPYIQGSSSITTLLSSGRYSTQLWVPGSAPTWPASARVDIEIAMDTLIGILAVGPNAVPPRSWTPTAGASTAAAALLANDTFIKKETTGFLRALSSVGQYPLPNYDIAKCERDVGYVLSAIRTDMVNGNNTEARFNANYYWSFGTPEVTNGSQRAATVTAYEFVKDLALKIATTPNVQPAPLNTGCGMRVDGSLAEGYLRSMVLDSFTQFNQGGKGIHILNNGYAQLVSIFTICCTEGVHAESGGSCSINTSNCSFGLSGLVASGYSLAPILTGTLTSSVQNVDEIRITSASTRGTVLYPGSTFPTIANTPYNGLVFTIGSNPTVHIVEGNPFLDGSNYVIRATNDIDTLHSAGERVNFYIRSIITSSSHTFEYIGSGIVLADAVPARGGVSNPDLEAVFDNEGIVYYTSTNQAGNFRVGPDFTILQETGTIEGDTFKRSILSLVTPLVLSLE